MDEEIREIIQEPEKKPDINPLEYVTIPIKEYRKMIRKIERMKAQLTESERMIELTKEHEQKTRWWREEQRKTEDLEKQLEKAQNVIKGYKADYEKLLGVDELKKAKLVEMQFEKGVTPNAES